MIQLERIRYRYPSSDWVLDGIDLTIQPQEFTAILGASGSGKTTLGYLFNGLIPQFFGGRLEGSCRVDGIDTRSTPLGDLLPHVGLVMQNADAQLFHSTVENDIAFGLESMGLPSGQIERRIAAVSSELQIGPLLARSPETLSGGEKRLAAAAAVLAMGAPLLILDEPFANLDWKNIQILRDSLKNIHAGGKTVVVIEQRVRQFLKDVHRCVALEKGRIILDDTATSGCTPARLRSLGLIPRYGERRGSDSKAGTPVLLSVRNLDCRIEHRDILQGVSLDLHAGEAVALVGSNGAGKTTLIRHFNGLLKARRGTVEYRGQSPEYRSPVEMAAGVGLCFQNPNDQFFRASVRDELDEGRKRLAPRTADRLTEIAGLLQLNDLMERSPHRLSEGEKKRVSIAAVLVMQPEILVLDEPTVGQNARFKEILARLLLDLNRTGVTTVVVTHDLEFAAAAASRWIVLHEGRVVADGPGHQIRRAENLIDIGALPPAAETKPHSAD